MYRLKMAKCSQIITIAVVTTGAVNVRKMIVIFIIFTMVEVKIQKRVTSMGRVHNDAGSRLVAFVKQLQMFSRHVGLD